MTEHSSSSPVPIVSVAMATHRGERYIGEQLASILGQSRAVDEIVISDDASPDATIAIAEEIVATASTPPRLTVLRNERPLRPARNFEQAIDATIGDFVFLSDQDDRWDPERVARVVARFEAEPTLLLVHGDARRIDAAGEVLARGLFASLRVTRGERRALRAGRAFDVYLRRNLVTGATVAFRRRLLDLAMPLPEGWMHDEWLGIIAAAHDGVGVVEEPMVDYRQHDANEIGAADLTVSVRLGRLTSSRAERNARLLRRAGALRERLLALGGDLPRTRIHDADEKLEHERVRSGYPARRMRRVVPVLREFATGRYSRYGRARFDVLRDVLQPLGGKDS